MDSFVRLYQSPSSIIRFGTYCSVIITVKYMKPFSPRLFLVCFVACFSLLSNFYFLLLFNMCIFLLSNVHLDINYFLLFNVLRHLLLSIV